jgi:DNA-binding GntR family transcriptional regulator
MLADQKAIFSAGFSAQTYSRPLSLPEQIANLISRAILNDEYLPGDPLREQELSEKFQVSRGPIREALRILETDGVVRITPNRGAQVTALSVTEVSEIFEIRAGLIGMAMRQACETADDELLDEAEQVVARMSKAAGRKTKQLDHALASYDVVAHLISAATNKRLVSMILSLARQTMRYTRLALETSDRRERSAELWKELIGALRARDAVLSEKLAMQLIQESRLAAIEALQRPDNKG